MSLVVKSRCCSGEGRQVFVSCVGAWHIVRESVPCTHVRERHRRQVRLFHEFHQPVQGDCLSIRLARRSHSFLLPRPAHSQQAANSLTELYNVHKHSPIPVEEHERKRKNKETMEIVQVCGIAVGCCRWEGGHGTLKGVTRWLRFTTDDCDRCEAIRLFLVSCSDSSQAAKKRGKTESYVREQLDQLETLLPDLINLHKLKASDW